MHNLDGQADAFDEAKHLFSVGSHHAGFVCFLCDIHERHLGLYSLMLRRRSGKIPDGGRQILAFALRVVWPWSEWL
ncbi:hypothetical protein [Pseudomonas amygdali]|uniref:hypothetical protein n=1 Tax=Pseudomonas amygdali TaxID=47877 RepID=UPI001980AEA1|nr:hypothetical protein [Pseudomonas amygdali]